MRVLQNDIWTRRERKDKRLALWINEEVLIASMDGTTEAYLRRKARPSYRKTVKKRFRDQDIMPDTGANYRYARKGGKWWYDYDRLPEGIQRALGTKEEIIAYHKAIPTMETRKALGGEIEEVLNNFAAFLPAYGEIDERRAELLAKACAVVQFAADRIGKDAPERDNIFYRDLAEVIAQKNIAYLPKNYRRLKEKIVPVIAGADVRKIIKLPRAGNQYARKEIDERVIGWILAMRCRGENFSNAHIARKVVKMCPLVGLKAPTKRWITNFLASEEVKQLTGRGRYGSSRRGSAYTPYVPIEGALHAGDCWQMDGTRFNMIPHASFDGKERSLVIIAVRDVHSGELIGYHFDTKEDRYGYIHALSMAVKAKGHLPYEIVHDRFPGHTTDEWTLMSKKMRHQGVKITVSSDAKDKAATERGFSTLQDVFMVEEEYYYGHGIQSTRAYAHRSPEYLKKVRARAKKEGFDFDMAVKRAVAVVEAHNSTPYAEYSRVRAKVKESPAQLYEISEKPYVYVVDDFRRADIFGLEKRATIRNNGLITIEIQHVKFYYQLSAEEYDVIKNYKQVRVCYDPADTTYIYVFEPSDDVNRRYLCTVMEQKAVKYYGPQSDAAALAKSKARHKAIKEKFAAELAERTAGAASDLDVLLAGTSPKAANDAAQDAWILERMDANKDKRHHHEPGNAPLPSPAPAAAPEEEYEEICIERLPRNY